MEISKKKIQLIGLGGFVLSGCFFTVSAILNRDLLTLIGSIVWIVACLIWMLEYKIDR